MSSEQRIARHEAEATLFSSSARMLGAAGFRDISFDIGGKKSRRRYVTATRETGEVVKIWVKPARTWRGMADAVLFPWKKYKNAHSGYDCVLFSCESAKKRGVTHLLAVAGDETSGDIVFSRLYSIGSVPELVYEQSNLIENGLYRSHSSSFVILSYASDFDEAAMIANNAGEDLLFLSSRRTDDSGLEIADTTVKRRTGRAYKRDRKVREIVLSQAQGRCECCGELGFETADGSRYLESHHIIEVSARGPDSANNMVAICPLCHRKAHYAKDRVEIERAMISAIRKRGKNNA